MNSVYAEVNLQAVGEDPAAARRVLLAVLEDARSGLRAKESLEQGGSQAVGVWWVSFRRSDLPRPELRPEVALFLEYYLDTTSDEEDHSVTLAGISAWLYLEVEDACAVGAEAKQPAEFRFQDFDWHYWPEQYHPLAAVAVHTVLDELVRLQAVYGGLFAVTEWFPYD